MLEKLILGLHELLLAALGNVVVFHGLIALEPAIHAAAELLDRALAERVLGQRKVLSGASAAAAKLKNAVALGHAVEILEVPLASLAVLVVNFNGGAVLGDLNAQHLIQVGVGLIPPPAVEQLEKRLGLPLV